MNPENVLKKVCRAIDILAHAGEPHEGLFPSLLDLTTHEMLRDLPSAIEGQRQGDRSHPGSNLIHDQAVLKTMYALSQALDRAKYARAADRYIQRFAAHCSDTVTGLFPWGEHAFWHLTEDRVGNGAQLSNPSFTGGATHDHLRQAPVWLWEKLYEYNPRCVERFAEGLDYHWKDGEPLEYSRHAEIEAKARPGRGDRSCDFPRHSGFYILDWAFAYVKTGRADFLEQIHRMVDYWWAKHDGKGLLLIESRSPKDEERFYNVNAPGQTLSLAASLLESSMLLDETQPKLAETMRQRAAVYINGFSAAPHDLEKGVFVSLCKRDTDALVETMPIWGSRYGVWPASYVASTALCAYRVAGEEELLRWSEAVGHGYLRESFPSDTAVPAMDAGLGLGLLADLYNLTDKDVWLDGAWRLARNLIRFYLDGDLPRGATSTGWYESQMGPSFLLHGLARLALLSMDRDHCPLEADYTAR